MSPKRIQSSPSSQAGEKSSPKKVKLGLQHPAGPLAPSRTKASPGPSRPVHPASCSAPKGPARKGPFGAPWAGRSSPAKGAARAGGPGKAAEESHAGKDSGPKGEGGQGEGPRGAKGPKVHPVQKQVVSRADLSAGDPARPVSRPEDPGSLFAKQCMAAWAGLPLRQEQREQHLRRYHQQFQQPPILHQKLSYQPLEKILARYKPQGVGVEEEEPPCRCPASPPCADETMQLEDLEDSDFSEDSFSPGPSVREAEAGAEAESNPASFFLHQREDREESWEVPGGQELFSNQREPGDKEAASPGVEEAAGPQENRQGHPEWDTQDGATVPPSPTTDTPEKPYCSQDRDVACHKESTREPLAGQKPPAGAEPPLSPPQRHFSGPEKAMHSLPMAPVLGFAVGGSPTEGPLQGHDGSHSGPAARKVCQENGAGCGGALGASAGFSVEMSPLTVSLLNAEMADSPEEDPSHPWQGRAEEKPLKDSKPLPPRNGWAEDSSHFPGCHSSPACSPCRTDRWRRKSGRVLSPETTTRWPSRPCRFPASSSPFGVESTLAEPDGCVCGFSAGDAGLANLLSLRAEKEVGLALGKRVASPGYDADTEATVVAARNSSQYFSIGEEGGGGPKAVARLRYLDVAGNSFCSSGSSAAGHAGPRESSADGISLEPSLGLQEREASQSQEALQLAFGSEEMGLLEEKPTRIPFARTPDTARQSPAAIAKGQSPGVPKHSLNGCCRLCLPGGPLTYQEALGRQVVLQIHRKQLDEMAGLCLQEEHLICQMSDLDFEDFVMKLDKILALKSRCLQGMRTQLQPFLDAPSGGTPPT